MRERERRKSEDMCRKGKSEEERGERERGPKSYGKETEGEIKIATKKNSSQKRKFRFPSRAAENEREGGKRPLLLLS